MVPLLSLLFLLRMRYASEPKLNAVANFTRPCTPVSPPSCSSRTMNTSVDSARLVVMPSIPDGLVPPWSSPPFSCGPPAAAQSVQPLPLLSPQILVSAAASLAAGSLICTAEIKVSPFNAQHLAVYNGLGQFFSGFIVNALNRCPADVHLSAAFFLREIFQINKPNGLIFINGHYDPLIPAAGFVKRAKPAAIRQSAYPSPFRRP